MRKLFLLLCLIPFTSYAGGYEDCAEGDFKCEADAAIEEIQKPLRTDSQEEIAKQRKDFDAEDEAFRKRLFVYGGLAVATLVYLLDADSSSSSNPMVAEMMNREPMPKFPEEMPETREGNA